MEKRQDWYYKWKETSSCLIPGLNFTSEFPEIFAQDGDFVATSVWVGILVIKHSYLGQMPYFFC